MESFISLFASFSIHLHKKTLQIILPVGISFYTFQTLSYTIDIYKKKVEPTRDVIAFFAFVSFFPQLVAGPIERAKNLLPQFLKNRHFDSEHARDGLRQILWGFFKKIVIADTAATQVDYIFNNSQSLSGGVLILGGILFAFQIYGDFSGYSDIAIGVGRLFGFNLMRNFAYPYFSRDIAEFWRRWHISLSSWFRDYVYIPLGGSRGNTIKSLRNIMIIFTVSGFWHGANWTFIVWGMLNGLYFLPLMLVGKNRRYLNIISKQRLCPSFIELFQIIRTFMITVVAWIFFRAENIDHALGYLLKTITTIFSGAAWTELYSFILENRQDTLLYILILVIAEWIQRDKQHGLDIRACQISLRWIIYIILTMIIIYSINIDNPAEFIYFQF
ncbi:MBOAT family O-acyltransferase [candidate division CSSED10-310 bacterium]|uniref:MBOAT family O-acyltransferase n=1 Tax=candidate division CSSED10-310 bacterium TaxID=2855610 RepID=A0ABV6Z333_UNCC1